MAERLGFEPRVPLGDTAFRVLHHRPLGHLSNFAQQMKYTASEAKKQYRILRKFKFGADRRRIAKAVRRIPLPKCRLQSLYLRQTNDRSDRFSIRRTRFMSGAMRQRPRQYSVITLPMRSIILQGKEGSRSPSPRMRAM